MRLNDESQPSLYHELFVRLPNMVSLSLDSIAASVYHPLHIFMLVAVISYNAHALCSKVESRRKSCFTVSFAKLDIEFLGL